jgi:hypothetical protein
VHLQNSCAHSLILGMESFHGIRFRLSKSSLLDCSPCRKNPYTQSGRSENTTFCKPEESLSEIKSISTLNFNLPKSRTVRNKCLIFKLLSLWYSKIWIISNFYPKNVYVFPLFQVYFVSNGFQVDNLLLGKKAKALSSGLHIFDKIWCHYLMLSFCMPFRILFSHILFFWFWLWWVLTELSFVMFWFGCLQSLDIPFAFLSNSF